MTEPKIENAALDWSKMDAYDRVRDCAPELLSSAREWADMSKPAREDWMNDTAYQAAGAAWDRLISAIARAEGRS